MKKITNLLIGVFCLLLLAGSCYKDLLNTRAPEWTVSNWMNSDSLSLANLEGNVVLIRWWTGPYCPFCKASSSALNEWQEAYRDRGLVIIGFYHHKSSAPFTTGDVANLAENMGFEFPIAIDDDWQTLRNWWLDRVPDAGYTSVSFLLDGEGIIRYIHPGGQYVKGDDAYEELKSAIEIQLRKLDRPKKE